MRKTFKEKLACEHTQIAKCIFQGLTIAQIAQKLNCSQSTVSSRMCSLFEKYNAKSRFDFILSVLGGIIDSNKQKIDEQNHKISFLKNENKNFREILSKIIENKENQEEIDNLFSEANNYLYK